MPTPLTKAEHANLERQVLAKKDIGEHEWPIEVSAMDEVAKLRLVRGRSRIVIDWVPSLELRNAKVAERVKVQIPADAAPPGTPREKDPGHSVAAAEVWGKKWLRERALEAHQKKETGRRDPTVLNDISLEELLQRFKASETYANQLTANAETVRQWDLNCDFLLTTLGTRWKLNQMSPDVLARLLNAYQRPWNRTLENGTIKRMQGTGYNSAVKMTKFLKRVCGWALAEPIGHGRFLLDVDPYARIPKGARPKEREGERKARGVATDEFASRLFAAAGDTGEAGQFAPILAIGAAYGRRTGEGRELRHSEPLDDVSAGYLLLTLEEVRDALEHQGVRRYLKDDMHIPDDELDEAAAAYFGLGGLAIRFPVGKAASANPDNAAQYDRVLPCGPWLASVLLRYRKDRWLPMGLPMDAPFFPARDNRSMPVGHSVVMNWWTRTVNRIDREGIRVPAGRTHTFRKRFRSTLRKEDLKVQKFILGWSLFTGGVAEGTYLPVPWRDLVDTVALADKKLAL
ncbi:MAG: hypothetical protein ACYC28_08425 [Longimicrobiales bacterium]|jgi:hypothetical protein